MIVSDCVVLCCIALPVYLAISLFQVFYHHKLCCGKHLFAFFSVYLSDYILSLTCFVFLEIESRILHVVGRCSTTELYNPSPWDPFFMISVIEQNNLKILLKASNRLYFSLEGNWMTTDFVKHSAQ